MMHGMEKSDSGIVAVKSANKEMRVSAESMERATLPLEDLAHGDGAVLGPGAATGDALAPGLGLGVEIVDIAPRAGGEEAAPDRANRPLHAPLGLGRRLPMIPPARPNYSR